MEMLVDEDGYITPQEESSEVEQLITNKAQKKAITDEPFICRKETWPKLFLDDHLAPVRGLRAEEIENIVKNVPFMILVGCSGAAKNESKKGLCLEALTYVLGMSSERPLTIVHTIPTSAFYWVQLENKEQVTKAAKVGVIIATKQKTFVFMRKFKKTPYKKRLVQVRNVLEHEIEDIERAVREKYQPVRKVETQYKPPKEKYSKKSLQLKMTLVDEGTIRTFAAPSSIMYYKEGIEHMKMTSSPPYCTVCHFQDHLKPHCPWEEVMRRNLGLGEDEAVSLWYGEGGKGQKNRRGK